MGGLTSRFGMELGVTLPLTPPLREIKTPACAYLSYFE
ncbi:hypothetical protein MNB_SV-9-672 [hydrothermal vent metagenome]|uniref:Uncharacterized protein n=1 Tax=hydrothermal vent metagenome TaxID=652676 RepID=A0A1W1BKM6_9ZZZZ